MTLLVLNIKLPDLGADSGAEAFDQALIQQVPTFVSWCLSFAILCRLWILQHALLVEGGSRSHSFVGWNFLFLGVVSFIPFPTSLLSEHHDQPMSVVIWSLTFGVSGIAMAGMWSSPSKRSLASKNLSRADLGFRRTIVTLMVTVVASLGLATFSPSLGIWVWIAFPFVAGFVKHRHSDSPLPAKGHE